MVNPDNKCGSNPTLLEFSEVKSMHGSSILCTMHVYNIILHMKRNHGLQWQPRWR